MGIGSYCTSFDCQERISALEAKVTALETENAELKANPSVGICHVCNTTIWSKSGSITDQRGMAHPICLVTQDRDALKAQIAEERNANAVVFEGTTQELRKYIESLKAQLAEADFGFGGWAATKKRLQDELAERDATIERLSAEVSDEEVHNHAVLTDMGWIINDADFDRIIAARRQGTKGNAK